MGENFASCLNKGPSRVNFPNKERQLQKLLLETKIASIPPFPQLLPPHGIFLTKIEEEISPPFTHTPNVQMGKWSLDRLDF